MPDTVTIAEIETAINAWCKRRPAGPHNHYAVCREARKLADIYGVMIYERLASVPLDTLTVEQRTALGKPAT
ncbi:DUF3717 domain-containing protein [Cupriavidus basilensis]